ncbi:MAG: hypothetical protein KUG80_02355 [Gammaproteobacteria bacterium]|nr:hypothetical protein [Gammaproteobacteria bacterium]
MACPIASKVVADDLMSNLLATRGLILEKIEDFTAPKNGTGLVTSNNDSIDNSSR